LLFFFARQTLLTQRSKYTDIQGKMKKKKIENVLLARDIEKLEELLITKKNLINTNNTLLQNWQKEVNTHTHTYECSINVSFFINPGPGYCTNY